jgi:chromosome segregation ATPase
LSVVVWVAFIPVLTIAALRGLADFVDAAMEKEKKQVVKLKSDIVDLKQKRDQIPPPKPRKQRRKAEEQEKAAAAAEAAGTQPKKSPEELARIEAKLAKRKQELIEWRQLNKEIDSKTGEIDFIEEHHKIFGERLQHKARHRKNDVDKKKERVRYAVNYLDHVTAQAPHSSDEDGVDHWHGMPGRVIPRAEVRDDLERQARRKKADRYAPDPDGFSSSEEEKAWHRARRDMEKRLASYVSSTDVTE